MDVQALLKSKNRCLHQLISVTEEALRAASGAGSILDSRLSDALPNFDRTRNAIFNAIELVDREISQAISKITPHTQPSQHQRQELKNMMEEQRTLIESLQSLDSRLFDILGETMRAGQKELTQHLKQRDQLNRFKSQSTPETGEGLDQKL